MSVLKDLISQHELFQFLQSIKTIKDEYPDSIVYPYVINTGYPFLSSGYASRSHQILKYFNKMYTDKKYIAIHNLGFPWNFYRQELLEIDISGASFLYKKDNVYYLTLPNISTTEDNYKLIYDLLAGYFKFNTMHVASNYKNAYPVIRYCKENSLISIYEVRGMWHISAICKKAYFNTKIYSDKDITHPAAGEKYCIDNCYVPLFITPQLKDYASCVTKYSMLPALDCNFLQAPIFWNCFNTDNTIIEKEKNEDKFVIGYIGAIVHYEGLIEAINSLKTMDFYYKKQIELHIVGDYTKFVVGAPMRHAHSILNPCFDISSVKFHGPIPHDNVIDMLNTFDLYIIPRLDMPVTNIVSPIKPYEPMSLKIPLLMSNCDCLKDISQDGKNCMLFESGNFDDFNEKIKYIIDNGYDNDILENGYNFVKNERNWTNMIKKVGLYDLLL